MFLLRTLLVFVIVGIVFGFIKQDNRRKQEDDNSALIILRLPRPFYWIGIICGIIFSVIFCFSLFGSDTSILDLIIFCAFAVLGFVIAVAASFWRIKIDKNGDSFTYVTSFGRTLDIKYDDITSYDINNTRLKFKVKRRAYYIDKYAVNLKRFVSILKSKRKDLSPKPGDPVIISYVGSGWIGVVSIVAFIVTWIFVVLLLLDDDADEFFKVSLFFITFIFLFLYLAIKGFNFKIYIYPFKSYFLYRNVFNKTYEIYFQDIQYVRFIDIFMKIKTKNKTCFFECTGMHNGDELLQAFTKNHATIKGKNKFISKGQQKKHKK